MIKVIGLILIVLGVLALVYGGFQYTKETHEAELGPLTLEVEEKDRLDVPVWAGVVSIAVGTGALLFDRRRGAAT